MNELWTEIEMLVKDMDAMRKQVEDIPVGDIYTLEQIDRLDELRYSANRLAVEVKDLLDEWSGMV